MLGFKLASLEAIKLKWEEQKVLIIRTLVSMLHTLGQHYSHSTVRIRTLVSSFRTLVSSFRTLVSSFRTLVSSLRALVAFLTPKQVLKIQRAALIAELESALSPQVAEEVAAIVRRITETDDKRRSLFLSEDIHRGVRPTAAPRASLVTAPAALKVTSWILSTPHSNQRR
jgi:hypothetical protein